MGCGDQMEALRWRCLGWRALAQAAARGRQRGCRSFLVWPLVNATPCRAGVGCCWRYKGVMAGRWHCTLGRYSCARSMRGASGGG